MTVVNFVLSNRDNVGKTFITWLLAQYKNSHGQKYKLFDADSNLSTCISRYGALNSRKGAITTDDFDELLSAIKSSYHDVIVDLPASFYRSAITAFKEKDYALLKNLEELDFKVVFHLPVGGNDFILQESVNAVNEVLTTLEKIPVIVWINHYPKEQFKDFYSSDDIYNIFADKGSLRYIVDLPRLTSNDTLTRENDNFLLEQILKENKTFSEILDPYKYKSAQNPTLNGLPVFILTDYQLSFLRDEFEKAIAPIAEIVF